MPERFKGDGYWDIVTRQMSIVTKSEQKRFKDSKIAVIGCGGIGGECIEMLARMGVGELILVDCDAFDLSNLNRQALSDFSCLAVSKSSVAAEKVRLINPYVKTAFFDEEVTSDNVESIVKGCDIVIDALDNILTRIIVSRKLKDLNIPFIHSAVHGTQGQITTFLPEGISYEEMFNLPSCNKDLTKDTADSITEIVKGVPPVIGPVPNIIGCLEAMEAFKYITGIGKVTEAPELLTFDLLDLSSFNLIKI